jgi:hypothetical protein
MGRMRIAAVAILAAWALFFSLAPLRGSFWLRPGQTPFRTDSTLTVVDVDPGGPAARAGIRFGDRVEGPPSFEDRLYLQGLRNPGPRQLFAWRIRGKNGLRPVTIRVAVMEVDTVDMAYGFVEAIIDLIFVVVGSILVLLRPSKMTWAFLLYCVALGPGLFFLYYWLPAWLDYGASALTDVLQSFSYGAFLIFCVRAPSDRASGKWRYLESIAAPLVAASLLVCSAATSLSIIGVLHAERIASGIQDGISDATYVVGVLALIATFWRERGVERSRVGWIIAGFAIAFAARGGANFTDRYGPLYWPGISSWLQLVPGIFQVAIPLTVAYAVVRYNALSAGVIANRVLVYGLFLCVGFAAFALLDILMTKTFANNEFEVGLDIALALSIGIAFQFVHPRAVRLIDRVFLPDRYHAAIAIDKLRVTLGPARHDDASANRAVEVVVSELMLFSLAVFKKAPDGGFVRFATAGWPKGTAWHIFSADPLVRSLDGKTRATSISKENTSQLELPPEPARPAVATMSAPTPAASLILIGAHVNGRRPDHDEIRGIVSLLREYGRIAS